jgi:hypothetical protein
MSFLSGHDEQPFCSAAACDETLDAAVDVGRMRIPARRGRRGGCRLFSLGLEPHAHEQQGRESEDQQLASFELGVTTQVGPGNGAGGLGYLCEQA